MSEILKDGGAVTITPGCDIVASGIDELKRELKGIIDGGLATLTIDLSGTKMIDSMGIGILIATYNSLKKKNVPLSLINVSPEISSLLKNMRLHQYFNIA